MHTVSSLHGSKNHTVVRRARVIEDTDYGYRMILMYIFFCSAVGHGHTMCKKEGIAHFHASLVGN